MANEAKAKIDAAAEKAYAEAAAKEVKTEKAAAPKAKAKPTAKKVAKAIDKISDCERVGVSVVGLEVPHAHVHLIPINNVDDMNFARMKLSPTNEELAETAKKISKAL